MRVLMEEQGEVYLGCVEYHWRCREWWNLARDASQEKPSLEGSWEIYGGDRRVLG